MNTPPTTRYWRYNPAPVLEAAFRAIHRERMAEIPILNPRLEVAAVGFSEWQGCWLGVLLTPWFLNLMRLPKEPSAWRPLPEGIKRELALPSGDYRFVGGYEETIGDYQFVSLLSPVDTLPDQPTALATAREVMELLLTATIDRGAKPAAQPETADAPCASRRGFLRLGPDPTATG